jgi:hypothetical protein
MRRFFCFWWRCAKLAARGTVPLARSWWWLLAIPIIGALRYLAADRSTEMILPNHPILDPILDAMLFTVTGFIVICGAAFVIRLFNTPAVLFHQQTERVNALEGAGLDDIAEGRREFVDQAFQNLDAAAIAGLRAMLISGRPGALPNSVWQSLTAADLVERDFIGPRGIREELREAVAAKLAQLRS